MRNRSPLHEHKQSLRTLSVQLSLQMIQVHDLLTDPVVQSVTRFSGQATLPCYDTGSAWFTRTPAENQKEKTVEPSVGVMSLPEKKCC